MFDIGRRTLLGSAGMLALAGGATVSASPAPPRMAPVAARHVRLKPSIFADAFAANRRYLLLLDPERLLHNFYLSAGLTPPAPRYGGWEALGIAGHSMGHWLTACALVVANTGDAEVAARLDHALAKMARIQAAHGDGYLGGTTVERDGRIVDGKIVFEEVRRGDIRSGGFDLNGGWVPIYTWHKIHAGLIDAHLLAGNPRALPILLGVAGYMAGVLEPLDDAQMQRVLHAEHGGLNESYAETYAITGDSRWLKLAERIHHRAVLDPLAAEQDRLAGLHANTQIPKVIGLARLHELTGNPAHATAARFFHQTVTAHHSYAIGGNSEREHFGPPDRIADRITEATCEACNSYNMLKLARHLYSWQPHARWFDIYERLQLNHIMAHQRPDTGQFVYFMPLSAGARRSYSTETESFWCCVGSGMESHAKHADSIYWNDGKALYVNLYIPSSLDWQGLALDLETTMPMAGDAVLTIRRAPRLPVSIALRLPAWAENPVLAIDGKPQPIAATDGYAILTRRWRPGERISLTLPMQLRAEPTPDDPSLVAFTHGPLVLAADMGPAAEPFEGIGPALVVEGDATAALRPAGGQAFSGRSSLGQELRFQPFFGQYDRRTAVYFPTFTPAAWEAAKEGYVRAEDERRALAARTVDIVYLGEMQPERDHGFAAARSETVQLHGRSGRKLAEGDSLEVTLARRPGPATLRLTFWGGDIDRDLEISIDGKLLAVEKRSGPAKPGFQPSDHALPDSASSKVRVRLRALRNSVDIYDIRVLTEAPVQPAAQT